MRYALNRIEAFNREVWVNSPTAPAAVFWLKQSTATAGRKVLYKPNFKSEDLPYVLHHLNF